MANGHGGVRAGAGRKLKAEKYGAKMDAADAFVARHLLKYYSNLDKLAGGGVPLVKETWKAACTVLIDDLAKDEVTGEIVVDQRGKPTKIHASAFPKLDPDALVLVLRTVEETGPNLLANQYLIDRLQGKPTASVEAEIKADAGDGLLAAFGGALVKIYGQSENGISGDDAGPGGDPAAAERG